MHVGPGNDVLRTLFYAVTNSLVLFCGASCDFNAFQSLSRGDNSRHNPKKVI